MTKRHINSALLEYLMALKGYKTRSSFADEIGVAQMTINNLLNDKSAPSAMLMNAIYKTLQMTPEQMVQVFFSVQSDSKNKEL